MITPRFILDQDDNTVTITIRAPYCNLSELDVSMDENVFLFTCTPYYLRLKLPGLLEENEHMKSSFNSDNGEFKFRYDKIHTGEYFPDLKFITKFLCTKVDVNNDGQQKIDIISDQLHGVLQDNVKETPCEYGFALRGGYNFKTLSTEFDDIFEIDPYNVSLETRRIMRLSKEKVDFNPDHYLADLMDKSEINEILKLESPCDKLTKEKITFSTHELDFLKDLTNIEYNLSNQQINFCYNGLLDILYAYCYDRRSTYFETTCESGWTISKLSATLCWFDGFKHPKEAIICAFRRSVIYPLFREFNFNQKVLQDLRTLLKLGEQYIIKCLIEIYNIFLTGNSGYYVFNNLFIKDYITYIMKWDKELWNKTVNEVNDMVISKTDLGLNLLQVEEEAFNISKNMENLHITDSDDSTSSESSDDYSSSFEE